MVAPPTEAAAAGLVASDTTNPPWRAVDVNGDGEVDLARALPVAPGSMVIETLISAGSGRWTAMTSPVMPTAQTFDWEPTDLDCDGRGDLVSVFNDGNQLLSQAALSDGDGSWTLIRAPIMSANLPATAQWSIADTNADGQVELTRLDDGPSVPTIDVAHSDAPSDTITTIDNGLGVTTTVAYAPGIAYQPDSTVPAGGCRPPAESLAQPVVEEVTTNDEPTGSSETSTLSFKCLEYSSPLRTSLDWQQSTTTHPAAADRPASSDTVRRDMRDDGVTHVTSDATTDNAGQVLSRTDSSYMAAANGPDIDELTSKTIATCQKPYCATSSSAYTYDKFGNVTSEVDRAAGSGQQRLITTSYLADTDGWLVSLPRDIRLTAPAHPAATLRGTITCYDRATVLPCDQPTPAARGLPTETWAWYGRQHKYVVTGHATYDQYGNKLTSTDADTTPTRRPGTRKPTSTQRRLATRSINARPWSGRGTPPREGPQKSRTRTAARLESATTRWAAFTR